MRVLAPITSALKSKLLTGKLVQATDMHAVIQLKGNQGVLYLPLQSVITNKRIEIGDTVEIYISPARVKEKENSSPVYN